MKLKLFNNSNKIFILPTTHGAYFMSVVFILFIISLTYGNSLAFSASFLFLAIIMTSAIYTHVNLSKIDKAQIFSEEIYQGIGQEIEVHLSNRCLRPKFDITCSIEKKIKAHEVDLAPRQSSTLKLKLSGLKRGVYKVSRVKIFSDYPFGIFYSWKYMDVDHEIVVYPAPISGRPFTGGETNEESEEGEVSQVSFRDEEFREHRTYTPHDHWRHIDWKAYASEKGLLVKQFDSLSDQEIFIDATGIDETSNESEYSEICKWVNDLTRDGTPFGVRFKDFTYPKGSGKAHQYKCLNVLARIGREVINL